MLSSTENSRSPRSISFPFEEFSPVTIAGAALGPALGHWSSDIAFGDGSGTSKVPIPDFDDFFAGLPSGFDAPPLLNESGGEVVAEGSRLELAWIGH
ncbi:hypothetical protein Bca52824_086497 [Brassica carinata]|uniref:Uncharacterized protein n=1 Tax=Brassica carinata TaxID=52824 RepID=A0A8X7TMA4_BRACI|nr:hypothetical protein Bca52824_086497 [Brassica carinata]